MNLLYPCVVYVFVEEHQEMGHRLYNTHMYLRERDMLTLTTP